MFRRDIGRKSLTVSGLLTFSTKVMKELLMHSKFAELQKTLHIAVSDTVRTESSSPHVTAVD